MLKLAKKVVWFMVQIFGWAFVVLYYAWFWPVLAILWVFDPGANEPEVLYWEQKDREDEMAIRN